MSQYLSQVQCEEFYLDHDFCDLSELDADPEFNEWWEEIHRDDFELFQAYLDEIAL